MIRILQECQSEDNPHKFQTGNIITHKRYGYRGVIVHTDLHFQGDENWYLSNQTQPSKEQSWYFVLVDRNQQVTYVAEQKRYIRNDVPWNPGQPPDAPPPLPPPNFKPPTPPSL